MISGFKASRQILDIEKVCCCLMNGSKHRDLNLEFGMNLRSHRGSERGQKLLECGLVVLCP